MKKLFAMLLVVLSVASLAACKKTTTVLQTTAEPIPDPVSIAVEGRADGFYFAAEEGFGSSGYRYYVVLEVSDEKIISAEWNGYHVDGYESKCVGKDKVTCAAEGTYGMNPGNPDKYWNKQAEVAEQFVLNKENITLTYKDAAGHSDDVASVSIHVVEFFDLVEKALANGTVSQSGTVDYVNGYHTVKGPVDTSKGDNRYSYATFVVVNNKVVLADINGVQPIVDLVDATKTYKTKDAAKENYNMHAGSDGMEWFEQAQRMEAYIVSKQNLSLTLTDEAIN
ncbi:MAG: hypothetical protein K0Q49_649 [Haloplasmataceae bacterium]|nr:hypothetical protein [Haloplasmataceae bacterium]